MRNYGKILERIGLSDKESSVYLDILEYPLSRLSDISKRTRIHRPTLYTILPLLKERGAIFSRNKGKRLYYHAANPSVLYDIARDAERNLVSIIPELQGIFEAKGNQTSITNYHSIKGIQRIYEEIADSLPEDGEYFAYTGKNSKSDPKFFSKRFYETRDKKRLRRFVIAHKERALLFRNDPKREIAYIQKNIGGIFEKNIVKIIYGNRVAIIDFSEITGFVIESPLLSALEKQHFKILFDFLKGD